MRNSHVQFVLAVLTLAIGGALEELLPRFLGIGVPVLLSAVQILAARRSLFFAVVFALAAGAVEDALSALPVLTSASWFLLMAVLVRRMPNPWPVIGFSYPLYQVWLQVWTSAFGGDVFGRILVAFPVGLAAAWVGRVVLVHIERKVAVDEAA